MDIHCAPGSAVAPPVPAFECAGNAEPVVVAVAGGVPVAVREAQVPGVVVPGTTAHNATGGAPGSSEGSNHPARKIDLRKRHVLACSACEGQLSPRLPYYTASDHEEREGGYGTGLLCFPATGGGDRAIAQNPGNDVVPASRTFRSCGDERAAIQKVDGRRQRQATREQRIFRCPSLRTLLLPDCVRNPSLALPIRRDGRAVANEAVGLSLEGGVRGVRSRPASTPLRNAATFDLIRR